MMSNLEMPFPLITIKPQSNIFCISIFTEIVKIKHGGGRPVLDFRRETVNKFLPLGSGDLKQYSVEDQCVCFPLPVLKWLLGCSSHVCHPNSKTQRWSLGCEAVEFICHCRAASLSSMSKLAVPVVVGSFWAFTGPDTLLFYHMPHVHTVTILLASTMLASSASRNDASGCVGMVWNTAQCSSLW